MPVETKPHHIVIIGGGPGGYEAALAGRQLGAEVTLIERKGVGAMAIGLFCAGRKGDGLAAWRGCHGHGHGRRPG